MSAGRDPAMGRQAPEPRAGDDPPPILGRWAHLYAVVLGVLAAIITLLAWLTRIYG